MVMGVVGVCRMQGVVPGLAYLARVVGVGSVRNGHRQGLAAGVLAARALERKLVPVSAVPVSAVPVASVAAAAHVGAGQLAGRARVLYRHEWWSVGVAVAGVVAAAAPVAAAAGTGPELVDGRCGSRRGHQLLITNGSGCV